MQSIGNLLHSMGETVGLVSPAEKKEEKKEEAYVPFSAPAASEGAAPAASSDAYPEWQRKQKEKIEEPKQSGGILSSIANAARAALVPPPLDADPVAETVEPIRPPTESAKPAEKEEIKEEAKPTFLGNLLNKVEAKIENALPMVAPMHAEEKKEEVQVSALGPVWEKDEEEEKKDSPAELKAGSWESEGGAVRKAEAEAKPPTLAAQRSDIGVSDASLQRVAKVADRVMAANAEERKAEKEKKEVKAEEAKPASPKEAELPRGADEKTEAETVGETAPAPAPKAAAIAAAAPPPSLSAVQQMSVNTIIRTVIEPIAKIDESKLPPLTADIAFSAPASMHGPTHHEYHPKHAHGARRVVHSLNQPQA